MCGRDHDVDVARRNRPPLMIAVVVLTVLTRMPEVRPPPVNL